MDQDHPDGDRWLAPHSPSGRPSRPVRAAPEPEPPRPPDVWSPHHVTQKPPDQPGVPIEEKREPARNRVALIAFVSALIGALVGGGIAGGVVAASDDHRSTTIVAPGLGAEAAAVRPSTALSKPGDIRTILAKVEPAVVRIDATAQPRASRSSRAPEPASSSRPTVSS